MLDGAFLVYLLIPGGSMFAHPELQIAAETKPPVAKRGNLLFVRNGYIFVVSTELAERITEGTAYHQTSDQEDQILRDRLIDIVTRMRFLAPAAAGAPAGPLSRGSRPSRREGPRRDGSRPARDRRDL